MPAPALQPGDQIHHYIVEATVGGGGTATVYRVRHAILQHALALKVLNPDHVRNAKLRQLFLNEGRIQASIRHRAIVMVTDAVVDAPRGVAGLVMEYVEGPNLGELIARTPHPGTGFVRSLAIPILEALHHAHGEGIVHRDIKPGNVLLTQDAGGIWHPRVADFGIAHLLHGDALTADVRAGTPGFMCAEQLDGGTPTPAWDVFAFGCLLYELCTGVHPFEQDDMAATTAAIRSGEYEDPHTIRPDLDPILTDVIRIALQPDPARRARHCGVLLDMLKRSSSDLPDPAEAPTRPSAPPPTHTDSVPPTFVEASAGLDHQRRVWRIERPEIRIGAADCDVSLGASAGLEPHHCTMVWDGHCWTLTDHSNSGTRVNGARISSTMLAEGDLIRVGHELLKFHTVLPTSPTHVPSPETPEITGPRLIVPGDLLRAGTPTTVPVTTTPLVIGRGPDADLRLEHPGIAPRHCQVMLQGLDVTIEDLGSDAGTLVDDHPIRYRRLEDGALIELAGARLRYRG